MLWRIYYDSGKTFDDTMGLPQDAPRDGACGIVQSDELYGREMLEGDWFVYREDTKKWSFHDYHGLIDQIVHFASVISAVRPGRYVTNTEWNRIKVAMIEDTAFPVRSAENPNVLR